MNFAIELNNLTKTYDSIPVINNLTLNFEQGKVTGLLGPNGAGKSTLLKMLVGLVKPDAGSINIFGQQPSISLNSNIAYLPDRASWYQFQTVKAAFQYANIIFTGFDLEKANKLAVSMKLDVNKKVSALSKGQQSCLYLIFCLARNVQLVLLDEPFSGIDLISREHIIHGIIDSIMDNTQTIIICTHEIYEAESLFEQVVFLSEGNIALVGNVEKLRLKEGSLENIYRRLFR
jgi:ABC-2 type transport system ATP-binding protein